MPNGSASMLARSSHCLSQTTKSKRRKEKNMYCCNKCGKWSEELPITRQVHGFTSIGNSYEEDVAANCRCGGDFVKAFQCEVCGDWFCTGDGEKPTHCICDQCVEEEMTVANAIEIGEGDAKSVKINGFICKALSEEQINNILSAFVLNNMRDIDKAVLLYCLEDEPYFREFAMSKKGSKND